jgi:flagellar motility protein MotE (MotC chaperone)
MIRFRAKQSGVRSRAERAGQVRPGGIGRRFPWRLALLATLLGLAGLMRLGEGLGQAMAETVPPRPLAPEEVVTTGGQGAAAVAPLQTGSVPAQDKACLDERGLGDLLEALRAREDRLAGREAGLAQHEATIQAVRSEIDRKIRELQLAEEKLAATLAQADQAAEKDVQNLVTVYESMKPKDAARLFGAMDPEFAAGFLGMMRPEAAAALMAGLDPQRAYAISAILAGRNALAPKS